MTRAEESGNAYDPLKTSWDAGQFSDPKIPFVSKSILIAGLLVVLGASAVGFVSSIDSGLPISGVLVARRPPLRIFSPNDMRVKSVTALEYSKVSKGSSLLTFEAIDGSGRSVTQNLEAPVSGTVLELSVAAEGQSFARGQVIMSILPEQIPLAGRFQISFDSLSKVKIGDELTVELEGPAGSKNKVPGTVVSILAGDVGERNTGASGTAQLIVDLKTEAGAKGQAQVDNPLTLFPGMPVISRLPGEEMPLIKYLYKQVVTGRR